QARHRVLASGKQDGSDVFQLLRPLDRDDLHALLGDQRIELVEIRGVGMEDQRYARRVLRRSWPVEERVLLGQQVPTEGNDGYGRHAGVRLQPLARVEEQRWIAAKLVQHEAAQEPTVRLLHRLP